MFGTDFVCKVCGGLLVCPPDVERECVNLQEVT